MRWAVEADLCAVVVEPTMVYDEVGEPERESSLSVLRQSLRISLGEYILASTIIFPTPILIL